MLVLCPGLEHVRNRLHSLWCLKTVNCPSLHNVIIRILGSSPGTLLKFLLCSNSFPEIIHLTQTLGQEIMDRVMYLTRTWVFALHRQKMKLLGRWPGGEQAGTKLAQQNRDTQQLTDTRQLYNNFQTNLNYDNFDNSSATCLNDINISQFTGIMSSLSSCILDVCDVPQLAQGQASVGGAHGEGEQGGQLAQNSLKSFVQSYLDSSPTCQTVPLSSCQYKPMVTNSHLFLNN